MSFGRPLPIRIKPLSTSLQPRKLPSSNSALLHQPRQPLPTLSICPLHCRVTSTHLHHHLHQRMEEQILLRVPPEIAQRLNRLIDENKSSSTPASSTNNASNQSPISLTFTSNTSVTLQCDKQSLEGTVVELPCIIETLKTFDNIAYYKTADIAQMIILHAAQQTQPPTTTSSTQPTNPPSSQPAAAAADKAKDSVPPPPIKYPSGLLPPTRDIRPKRYERDTLIQPRIVSDVETMLMYIRDETPVHTFRLIEEEVEIEVDEEDEWEEDTDMATAGGAVTATPASGARTGTSTSSQPQKPSPLPTIRIETDPATGATTSTTISLSPSASALRPPTSSRMSPSFSPAFLGGGSGTPSFTPSLGGTDEEDERMRDVSMGLGGEGMAGDDVAGLLASPRVGGVATEEEKSFVAGLGGKDEKSDEAMAVADAGALAVSAEAAGKESRRSELLAELSDVERRIEEMNAQISKEQNRIFKRRMQTEKLQPLEEERSAKQKELDAL